MRRAAALALKKMQGGSGGPFAALIVRGGEVVAEGWNAVTTLNDPTAHAEVMAIREACRRLAEHQHVRLVGAATPAAGQRERQQKGETAHAARRGHSSSIDRPLQCLETHRSEVLASTTVRRSCEEPSCEPTDEFR